MAYYKISDYQINDRTDSQAFQAMFDDVGGDRTPIYLLEGGRFNLNEPVYYQKQNSRQGKIVGDGAIVNIADNVDGIIEHPSIKDMRVGTNDQNNIIANFDKLDVDHVIFRGGKTQLRLVGQRGSLITNCTFEQSERAISIIFGMHCVVRDCRFMFQDLEAIVLRSGVSDETLMTDWGFAGDPANGQYFLNASTANSQCNRSVVENCWFFGKPGQKCMIRVQASDGIKIINPILEGVLPKFPIYADSRNSTVTHTINIHEPHIEGPGDDVESLIYIREFPYVYISKLFSQVHDTQVLAYEGNLGKIYMDNMMYIPWDTNTFKSHSNVRWVFNQPEQQTTDAARNSVWEGGVPRSVLYYRDNEIVNIGSDQVKFMSRPAYRNDEEGITIGDNAIVLDHPSLILRGTRLYGDRSGFASYIKAVINSVLKSKGLI